MAMAIHTASKKPRLTWNGWKHIAVALAIGSNHAQRTAQGRKDTPYYRRVMTNFLRATGLVFLNKDDRAQAIRLLPYWTDIDAWRSSLPLGRQQALNNPREVWTAYQDHCRVIGHPDARPRPAARRHRAFPSLLEQFEAVVEQLEMAQERADRAERESEYFALMMQAIAEQAEMSEDDIAQIRARVRTAHEGDDE